jgi:hypothetical protein
MRRSAGEAKPGGMLTSKAPPAPKGSIKEVPKKLRRKMAHGPALLPNTYYPMLYKTRQKRQKGT